MSTLHPETQAVFGWAKRAAKAAGRDRLTLDDVLCGLLSASRDGRLTSYSWAAEGLSGGDRSPAWPDQLVRLHELAAGVPAKIAEERWGFDPTVDSLVKTAHRLDATMGPAAMAPAIKAVAVARGLDWIAPPAVPAAPPGPAAPAPSPRTSAATMAGGDTSAPSPLQRLDRISREAAALTAALKQAVLGQDAAVEMMGDAFFRARLRGRSGGLRGVFTLMGPSGVGKTLLATSLAEALQAATGDEHAFRRFDMGGFGGPQSFEQLLGAESFYKGSRPGSLTGFVREHPRAVILFDEIEKAHEHTLQALLAAMDRGESEDKALAATVSFRDAWFVFTTNLGAEFFESANATGVAGAAGTSPAGVFDLLRNARRRQERGEGGSPALSPEFVSRLAKGGAVLFQPLRPGHFLELIERQLAGAGGEADGVRLSADADARLLFLLSLLPDLDARRVVAASQHWASCLLKDAFDACRGPVLSAAPGTFAVRVMPGADAREALTRLLRPDEPVKVLVVDDDEGLPPVIQEGCAGFAPVVERVAAAGDVLERARRFTPDLLLLDLSIGEEASSPRVDRALSILRAVREALPDLPVHVFSENPERRTTFEAVVARVLEHGGARGFLPWHRGAGPLQVDDFVVRFNDVLRDRERSALIRRHARSRTQLTFDVQFRWDEGPGEVVAELAQVRTAVNPLATDRSAAITFAGIPPERFVDVAGLERAKRRLREVCAWLSQPAALTAFGVQPPRGFLLAGPPGTGKTLLARALAGEAGLPFFALGAGELLSKWYGESEERVRELFARARRYAPAIVFIDEIDAIASARHEQQHEATGRVLNQLLAEMDGFRQTERPVFVLAATNRPDALDPAIKRPGRFDETIPIDLPRAAARKEFFDLAFRRLRVKSSADIDWLVRVTAGFSPAELDRVVRESAYLAVAAGAGEIGEEHAEQAARTVRFGARRDDLQPRPEELRRTAYHEAGHAAAHLVLFPNQPVDYLSVIPTERGMLGVLATEADETSSDMTREALERMLVVSLAGRAGERLTPGADGVVSSGASSDLAKATRLAHIAVTRWGFDDSFGPVSLEGLPPAAATAVEATAAASVKTWVTKASAQADALAQTYGAPIARLAETLLREESLDGDEVKAAWAAAVGGAQGV